MNSYDQGINGQNSHQNAHDDYGDHAPHHQNQCWLKQRQHALDVTLNIALMHFCQLYNITSRLPDSSLPESFASQPERRFGCPKPVTAAHPSLLPEQDRPRSLTKVLPTVATAISTALSMATPLCNNVPSEREKRAPHTWPPHDQSVAR